jgi:hypothetical protein
LARNRLPLKSSFRFFAFGRLLAPAILCVMFACGCNVLNDLVGDLTEHTITVSQTIENDSVVSEYYFTPIAENILVAAGQTQIVGPCSLSSLADPIEISQLGLGQMAFFFTVQMANLGDAGATVLFAMSPNAPGQSAVGVTELHLSPQQSLTISPPQTLSGNVAAINGRLTSVFNQLDADQNIYLAIAVEGGDANGVLIQQIGIATPPAYLQTQKITADGLSAYRKDISRVYDPELLGGIYNNGAGVAEVRLYLRRSNEANQPDDPIGLADINPGDSVAGDQLIQAGGYDRIQQAFGEVMDGAIMNYYYTAISTQTIDITSDDLRIQAKVEIKIHPF